MLVMTATDNHLQRSAIMKLAEWFNLACSMVYRLWECMACMHAMGTITSPELILQGGNSGRPPIYLTEFV